MARPRCHGAFEKRREFSFLRDTGFVRQTGQFTDLLRSSDPAAYERNYRYNISPVGDNQPFFFYTVQPRDLLAFLQGASHDTADYKINVAVSITHLFRTIH